MKKLLFLLISLLFFNVGISQENAIPKWFLTELKADVGTWKADNSRHMNDQEPFSEYRLTWTFGINKKSVLGKLYGILDGESTSPFWEFRKFWDAQKQAPGVMQFGTDGTFGSGNITYGNPGETELIQVFVNPDGTQFLAGHRTVYLSDSSHVGTSYRITEEGSWHENRTYTWTKEGPESVSKKAGVLDFFNSCEGVWEGIPEDTSFISVLEFNKEGSDYFVFVKNDLLSKARNPFSHYEGKYFFNPHQSRIEFITINKDEIHSGHCKISNDTLHHFAKIRMNSGQVKAYTSAIVKSDSNTFSFFADYSKDDEFPELTFKNPLIYRRIED